MNPIYDYVAERANHRCEYCLAPEIVFNFPFEVDHCVPLSSEGGDHSQNLALACSGCNRHKSNRISGLDEFSETAELLFNPRNDQWREHFVLRAETAELEGMTPTGRVTVQLLKMNRPQQLQARAHWIRMGLFP